MELEKRGRVARLTRRAHNPEIPGSNPGPATSYILRDLDKNYRLKVLLRFRRVVIRFEIIAFKEDWYFCELFYSYEMKHLFVPITRFSEYN